MKLPLAVVNRPTSHPDGPVRHAFPPAAPRSGRANTLCGVDARRAALGDDTVFEATHPRACKRCAAGLADLVAAGPQPLRTVAETSAP